MFNLLNDWTLGINQILGSIPVIVQISKGLSWLGIGYLYYLLSAYLIIKKDHRAKVLWYYWTTAAILNAILKYTFAQPRPYWIEPNIQAFEKSISFGMPSGHAQSACGVVLLFLLYRLGWVWGMLWVLLMALARVVLGVHSVAQVLVGMTLGMLMVAWFHFKPSIIAKFFEKKWIQWTLIMTAFIYGVYAIQNGAKTIDQVSQAWVNAPSQMKDSFKVSSLFVPFGFLTSFLLAQHLQEIRSIRPAFLITLDFSKIPILIKWNDRAWFPILELLLLFIFAWSLRFCFVLIISQLGQSLSLESVFFKGLGDLFFCFMIGFYLGRKS
jgi:membrane-associated phospholipid phosphatase